MKNLLLILSGAPPWLLPVLLSQRSISADSAASKGSAGFIWLPKHSSVSCWHELDCVLTGACLLSDRRFGSLVEKKKKKTGKKSRPSGSSSSRGQMQPRRAQRPAAAGRGGRRKWQPAAPAAHHVVTSFYDLKKKARRNKRNLQHDLKH